MERQISIPIAEGVSVDGDLAVPQSPAGVVVFAHGSGSGRHSPRNRMVAAHLQRRRLATLLIDLLTEDEERVDMQTRHLRFDVELLARRLVAAAEWIRSGQGVEGLPIGYFGASTGAAAALIAAADTPKGISAVVSRGGRPDLAGERLPEVQAPTLLIVGGRDEVVLELNRQARARLTAPSQLEIVPGATHLFEEPGALEAVAELAGDWLSKHLAATGGGGT
ncbi:MAG: dienelactone hydrolase family protein [Actinomycetota bacterium]|nr:dienelactone hydrolase family protein [Actinomycetota bacterium]